MLPDQGAARFELARNRADSLVGQYGEAVLARWSAKHGIERGMARLGRRRSRTREMECEARNRERHGEAGKKAKPYSRDGVRSAERKIMNRLDQATDEFITAILGSAIYRTYRQELDKVKQVPGLKEQIDEFRKRNFELQLSADMDFGKLDSFEKEYENFRANPLVADFLAAELDLCRAIQRINMRITAELKFE